MKSQAKAINRTKILLVLIPIIILGGTFLLQKLKSGESSEQQKPLSAKEETSRVANNTNSTSNKSSEGQSIVAPQKTPLEVSSSINSQTHLVVKDKVSELELPYPFEDYEIDAMVARAQAERVYREQDKIMATWSLYLDVREKLHKELFAELDLDALSNKELVDDALKLRNKFWQEGGNLSTVSYKDGYKARILLELAHDKDPQNMVIIDELIETIQSVEFAWKYKVNSKKKLANPIYQTILPDLRSAQFEQIKKEVEQGRTLTWQDFVRTYELALLWGRADKNKPAQEIVTWLIPKAEQAGYETYIEQLERLEQKLKENSVLEFNIYVPHKSSFTEELQYGRRFPSFQGPNIEKRGILPVHVFFDNPIWHRDAVRNR